MTIRITIARLAAGVYLGVILVGEGMDRAHVQPRFRPSGVKTLSISSAKGQQNANRSDKAHPAQ